MSDLIADLRQKLADFEPLVELGYFGGNELTSAAIDALPGLLDELEAARWLIDALPSEPRTWGIRYDQARAANG